MKLIRIKDFKEYLNSLGEEYDDIPVGFAKVNENAKSLADVLVIDRIIGYTFFGTEDDRVLLLRGRIETDKAADVINKNNNE